LITRGDVVLKLQDSDLRDLKLDRCVNLHEIDSYLEPDERSGTRPHQNHYGVGGLKRAFYPHAEPQTMEQFLCIDEKKVEMEEDEEKEVKNGEEEEKEGVVASFIAILDPTLMIAILNC
jgi:hypothetical protein